MDYTQKSREYIPSENSPPTPEYHPHTWPQHTQSRSYSPCYAPASPIYSPSLSPLRDRTPPRRSMGHSPYQLQGRSPSQDNVPLWPEYRRRPVPSEYECESPEYRPTMSVPSEQEYATLSPEWNPSNEYPAGSEYAFPSHVNNPSSPAATSEYRSLSQEQAPQSAGYGNENSPVGSSSSGLDQDPVFNCGICLRLAAEEPVVTSCGHLYCWQCLYNWLHHLSNVNQECPICRGKLLEDMIYPVYVHSSANNKVPPRPQGRRIDKD